MTYLQQRAAMLATIRDYFQEQGVLEVETPILSPAGNTDPVIESFRTTSGHYLHTSPELAMKRLLAMGSGSIYQICKVFREEECGRLHQPEFTMLEWYRVGFDYSQLMDDVALLVKRLYSDTGELQHYSYRELFSTYVGVDPLEASNQQLLQYAQACGLVLLQSIRRDDLLNILFDKYVGAFLSEAGTVFVRDYPASQASLARLHQDDQRLAERFELYINGIEIANGFHELTDADEQQQRFEQDLLLRCAAGQHEPPVDTDFLAALRKGLPDCSGVAVGLDRLLMLICSADSLDKVMNFPFGTS